MNNTPKADPKKLSPAFKLEDVNGLSREHLARVCDVMDMATHFENMLNDEPVAVFDREAKECLEEHIHLKFDKKETAAIKEILAECYKPVWCHEIHELKRSINILNVELCEKGNSKKAFKKLTRSYKNLKKYMRSLS